MNTIKLPNILLFLSIIPFFLFLNYQQVFSGTYESDTFEHINLLKEYFNNGKYLPHPMWHYGSYTISKLFQISHEYAAVVFSTFIMGIWIIIIQSLVEKSNINSYPYPKILKLTIILSILFIGPLILPPYDYIIYQGKGSPNIWHNTTIWMVKPFAILAITSFIYALKADNIKYYLISLILSILSLYAKPSFIIVFIPTLFILVTLNKLWTKNIIIFLTFLTLISIVVLRYQFLHTFSESEVIIDFLGVWSSSSSNIPLSIILALAFPLTFLLLYQDQIKEYTFQLLWIQTILSILIYAIFAQSGKQYFHANFSWSYMITMSFLYVFSIIKFINIYHIILPYKKYLLLFILFIQTFIGIYYFIKILQGQNPIYIAIFL